MKNHYVSQFIIKRFSKKINIFNINNGIIEENKQSHKVFYKEDLYSEEIEKIIGLNIESKVANILDNKVLVDGNIVITREELYLLKQYMLICSVRTLPESHFCNLLKIFEKNADKYISIWQEYNFLKKTKDLNLSDKELYLRTLKVFASLKENNIEYIANHPLVTREMLAWAMPFLESYIAFWDTPSNMEYVLTDCGMCSEYEGFHNITGGIDISKASYLISQIENKKYEYGGLLASNAVMYENYSIYNLSSNRSMVMINPFFKLYNNIQVNIGNDLKILDNPSIWPAIIQNRKLFETPKNKYVLPGYLTPEDLFIYEPKTLTKEDLIYINSLILSQTKEIIGFKNAENITDSIYYYLWYNANFNSIKHKDQPINEILDSLANNVVNSTYKNLCNYCESKGGINKTNFIQLFEKLLSYIFKDFDENPYICKYYLKRPLETINCKALDFLGESNKKLEVFKEKLNKINGGKND